MTLQFSGAASCENRAGDRDTPKATTDDKYFSCYTARGGGDGDTKKRSEGSFFFKTLLMTPPP